MKKAATREEWLERMTTALRPKFKKAGYALPRRVRVSCGWPAEGALRKEMRIGECWVASASEGGTPEIFVSPALADSVQVAGTLVHELIHAVLPEKEDHGKKFRAAMAPLGLEGKATATTIGDELRAELAGIVKEIGPYPHARIKFNRRTKKQSTRLLKAACPECGYTIRVTAKWVEVGLPTCVCGGAFEAAGGGEGE